VQKIVKIHSTNRRDIASSVVFQTMINTYNVGVSE